MRSWPHYQRSRVIRGHLTIKVISLRSSRVQKQVKFHLIQRRWLLIVIPAAKFQQKRGSHFRCLTISTPLIIICSIHGSSKKLTLSLKSPNITICQSQMRESENISITIKNQLCKIRSCRPVLRVLREASLSTWQVIDMIALTLCRPRIRTTKCTWEKRLLKMGSTVLITIPRFVKRSSTWSKNFVWSSYLRNVKKLKGKRITILG